jgi:hypothetical protein
MMTMVPQGIIPISIINRIVLSIAAVAPSIRVAMNLSRKNPSTAFFQGRPLLGQPAATLLSSTRSQRHAPGEPQAGARPLNSFFRGCADNGAGLRIMPAVQAVVGLNPGGGFLFPQREHAISK